MNKKQIAHFVNKNKVIITIFSVLILISISFSIFLTQEPDNYIVKSKTFGELSFWGDTVKNKPHGKVTIKNEDKSFYLKGNFEDGIFKNGYVVIKKGDKTFYMDGVFESFLLQEGYITITTKDEKIEKRGTFIDNKLNGVGSLKITDLKTGQLKFVYAGKFKNDTPIYK